MASLGQQLLCFACRGIRRLPGSGELLSRHSRCFSLSSVNHLKRRPEPMFTGFKVEPRQPITDLVTHSRVYSGSDPAPIFLDCRVQAILQSVTGCNHEIVFRHRKVQAVKPPTYYFLTDKQFKEMQERATKKAAKLLLIPPVLLVKSNATEVLSKDPALQGLHDCKHVFTDISANISANNRLIVTREADGTLRHANVDERRRMNEIYKPRFGRSLVMPDLFSTSKLQNALSRRLYEFVLDKACIQLEPDDELFQSILATTYDAVDEYRHYDDLLSTRYYGSMLFYLVWHSCADAILEEMINKDRLEVAGEIVKLFILVHPSSKTALAGANEEDALQLVKNYMSEDCSDKESLELSLKRNDDLQKSKAEFNEKAMAAHGQ